jgi:hypothetical protein
MKPPVVVIGRHCNTNQCRIAVRFKKTQSVAKIAQSSDVALQSPRFANKIIQARSVRRRLRRRRRMILAVIVVVATAETALARPKKHRVDRGSAKGTGGAARQPFRAAAAPLCRRSQRAVGNRVPALCGCLQTAANQSFQRPRDPAHSLFSAQRGSRQQPNKDFYVGSGANN